MAKILEKDALTFDDVLLVPQYSEITPDMADVSTKLTNTFKMNVPFLSAAMDTVSEHKLVTALALAGGLGVIHKNMSIADQAKEVEMVKNYEFDNEKYKRALIDKKGRLCVGAAIGVTADMMDRVHALMDAGVDVFVLDSARGDSKNIINAIKNLRLEYPSMELIAGNVATYEGALDLMKAGASAVKVGMGPGSICTTRIIAGIGVPQLQAVMDCARASKEMNVPIIADGGIKYSGDVVKALAAGANTVMLGGLFATCEEAPGDIYESNGKKYRTYRGMGSIEAMAKGSTDRYFQTGHKKFVAEGVQGIVEVKTTVEELVFQLIGGLKAGMGYCGSKDIPTLQEKGTFIKITNNALLESHPHDISIDKGEPNYSVKLK